MFQFGEMLTLTVAAVTVTYVLVHRRQVGRLPGLRPLMGPFLLMAVAWAATVLEGLGETAEPGHYIVFLQAATTPGIVGQALNLVEHVAYAAACVWLLLVALRMASRAEERPA